MRARITAHKINRTILFSAGLLALGCIAASAQQTTGVPGSPDATTTINGQQLPPPDPKFGGVIKDNALQSKAWWPPRVVPPKGAPNILLIMTDDVGFAAPSTFGGVIPTPSLDRIAQAGLRYTQFHSTSLCSPTRAALITGRNHHAVGFGVVSEIATGFPGYDSIIPKDAASIGAILKENGYATSWFGKNHNTPSFAASQAGPFDQWPIGMGFEYFYGFVGGDTSQWQPNLFRNTTAIYPYLNNPKWNLITAMADGSNMLVANFQGIEFQYRTPFQKPKPQPVTSYTQALLTARRWPYGLYIYGASEYAPNGVGAILSIEWNEQDAARITAFRKGPWEEMLSALAEDAENEATMH